MNSRHLNLLDFGLEISGKTQEEKLFKIGQNQNRLLDFVELTFNYQNINKYKSKNQIKKSVLVQYILLPLFQLNYPLPLGVQAIMVMFHHAVL